MGIVLVDVETIDHSYQGVCDIAWAIVERNKLVAVKNFIVAEHIDAMAHGSFSKGKFVPTMVEVLTSKAKFADWDDIMAEYQADTEAATRVYAYNAPFDRHKIRLTSELLGKPTDYLTSSEYNEKWRDLWAWAANTVLFKKSFLEWIAATGKRTPRGYASTTAETALQFIKQNLEYVERHTARADVLDELEIYLELKRFNKSEWNEKMETVDEVNFRGSPTATIKKLELAINS